MKNIIKKISTQVSQKVNSNLSEPSTVIAENKDHLIELIKESIDVYGKKYSLNHIDVSRINDM